MTAGGRTKEVKKNGESPVLTHMMLFIFGKIQKRD